MQTNGNPPASPQRTAAGRTAAPATVARGFVPSIGWRLALGLAAVAAVLVASEILSTRTTREALDAVRIMQHEHEPLASSANAVLEKLVAFDGIVSEFMRSGNATEFGEIAPAADALDSAMTRYFGSAPQTPAAPDAPPSLRERLTRAPSAPVNSPAAPPSVANGPRKDQADLNQIHDLLVTAGGTGVPIDGTQVYGRRQGRREEWPGDFQEELRHLPSRRRHRHRRRPRYRRHAHQDAGRDAQRHPRRRIPPSMRTTSTMSSRPRMAASSPAC